MATLAPTAQQIPARAPQVAADFVALAQLRSRASTDAGAVTAEAARQFEALFVQMMLQSMRQAGDVFGDGSDTTYRDMFDQQIALEMTRGKGLGLAELLTRQLAAPQAAAANAVRAPGVADVVVARSSAPPSLPTARVERLEIDHDALVAAAALPAFEPGESAWAAQSWRDWRPASPEEFVRDIWPLAERAGEELGVDPRAIVAQAALETGWGRRISRDAHGVSGNNLFNIKADSRWGGERLSVRTLEFEGGLPKPRVAAFRAYPDLGAAFEDYVRFLKGNPRYAEALANGAEPARFAESLQAAGYATDPGYADKLRSIVSSPRFNDVVGSLKNAVRLPTL
jgi:flagellar protein FlgJ